MIRFGDRDTGPVGPVRDLQRALLADGRELPRFGDDGDFGNELWAALEEAAQARRVTLPPRARGAEVPAGLLAKLPVRRPSDRRIPIDTARRWPARGARAWLAERADGARLHAGVDLGVANDLVVAPEACQVVRVIKASYGGDTPRYSQPGGWGGYGPHAVLVRAVDRSGLLDRWHLFAHVDRVEVETGDRLPQGEGIARVAPKGNHLHWEVRAAETPTGGAAVVEIALDPGDWLYGLDRRWRHGLDPCPKRPERSSRTPRPCRPGER